MHTRISRPVGQRRKRGLAAALTFALLMPALLAGCASSASSEPSSEPAPVAPSSAPPAPSTPPTPVPVDTPIPAACEQAYSPELLATLQANHPPLNDPSMSTATFSDIERLDNTIRASQPLVCTWGVAGPIGIATAVSRIAEQQAVSARSAMEEGGFACTPLGDAVSCVIQREGDKGFTVGESHYLRGTIAVSTRWINTSIDGYTEGMVAAIWG
ncbi:hypothetical protein L1277_000026 [Okibacterium sp. HSC-33S16]|uniref:hypothetical protein n=1 Tax=Okibacterium sp. HSC-33S16 TaxID=2910965 RepID=UPI00209F4C6B|nr:hypothetical protein [Okibacterium sp. HSC-33S16]MCP2029962.1 hypothetical protein [Okibacterium sp. HSC-33S16]